MAGPLPVIAFPGPAAVTLGGASEAARTVELKPPPDPGAGMGGSRPILVPLVALLMLSFPSQAASPLDDDAGSGGDASDNAALALAVAPGGFGGTLTPPVDRLDYYAFQAQAGQLVTLGQSSGRGVNVRAFFLDAEAPACGEACGRASVDVASDASETFVAPFGGTWGIVVFPRVENDARAIPYEVRLEVEDPVAGVVLDSTARWNVMEARATVPGHRIGWIDVQTPDLMSKPQVAGNTRPFSAMLLLEVHRDGHAPGGLLVYIQGQGTGARVEVTPLGVSGDVPVRVEQGRGLHQAASFWLNEPGTLRVTTLHTGGSPRVELAFAADAPTEIRTASGDAGVVTMSDGNQAATVRAPGLHVAPERTMTLDVEGRFAGVWRLTTGATGARGHVEDPSGHAVAPAPGCGCIIFTDPAPGRWTFTVEAQARAGPADHEHLAGAFVPRLGLYPA